MKVICISFILHPFNFAAFVSLANESEIRVLLIFGDIGHVMGCGKGVYARLSSIWVNAMHSPT